MPHLILISPFLGQLMNLDTSNLSSSHVLTKAVFSVYACFLFLPALVCPFGSWRFLTHFSSPNSDEPPVFHFLSFLPHHPFFLFELNRSAKRRRDFITPGVWPSPDFVVLLSERLSLSFSVSALSRKQKRRSSAPLTQSANAAQEFFILLLSPFFPSRLSGLDGLLFLLFQTFPLEVPHSSSKFSWFCPPLLSSESVSQGR